MRSFTCLSLLICGSTVTVLAGTLNLQPQPVPRSPPDRSAQSHLRAPAKVFYHDTTLARRSAGSTHARLARSAAVISENDDSNTSALKQRGGSARLATFAAGALGACGTTFTDSDFVVALNEADFDAANHCYANITISYGGKSTEAQIVDLCPGCPPHGLDLTSGLFSYFAPTSLGVLYGEWTYDSGQPKSTENMTNTKEQPTSISQSMSQSTTHSTHLNNTTSTAQPVTSTIPVDDPQVVNQLNMAILDMAGLMATIEE